MITVTMSISFDEEDKATIQQIKDAITECLDGACISVDDIRVDR